MAMRTRGKGLKLPRVNKDRFEKIKRYDNNLSNCLSFFSRVKW